jgi:hypothetical protein
MVAGGGESVEVDSVRTQGFCLPADCAVALSDMGKAGKLSASDGCGARKISLIADLRARQ